MLLERSGQRKSRPRGVQRIAQAGCVYTTRCAQVDGLDQLGQICALGQGGKELARSYRESVVEKRQRQFMK